MNKGIGLFVGLTVMIAMGSAHAGTCPTVPAPVKMGSDFNPDTGHFFEVYSAPAIEWEDAKACANKLDPGGSGVYGHLATLTSSKEDAWVDALRRDNVLGEVWVGGSQPAEDLPGVGWLWENSEGAIATTDVPLPSYSNWLDLEPNDAGGSESYLAIGLGNQFGWNDEGNLGNITGFVVEYDVPRNAACEGADCQTIDGQTLVFPPGSFEEGQTVGFTAYEFSDPRADRFTGKCTVGPRQSLTLFKESDGFGPGVELRIPPYLCGSPDFVVVKVNSEDLSILKGAVLVVNDTEVVLPDNLFKCSDPIPGNEDPQYQDVVVWQSTNPDDMLENATTLPTYTGNPDYVGAATEATNGCGSTVAKVRGASYFVVGLHIDFNLGAVYPTNKAQNYAQFKALTRYKLTLLRKSIVEARSVGSLRPLVSTAMDALIALAIFRLDRDNPAGALIQVRQFLQLVNAANYTAIPDRNYNGDHLMRGENIAFTLKAKVIPYK